MRKSVAIIGGGPASLMLAATLDEKKFDVTIYEKNAAVGRKFLVAGDGGFNLTHSENIDDLVLRYTPPRFLNEALHDFTNVDLRKWFKEIGVETFVGTSKRVFPVKGVKPIDVLNAVLRAISAKGVTIKTKHEWLGWNTDGALAFNSDSSKVFVETDFTVFALGGASWKKTGSDGTWIKLFEEKLISINDFFPSNCTYKIEWGADLLRAAEGKAIKNISVSCGEKTKAGEFVITKFGVEGGAIYALSPQIRNELWQNNSAVVYVDLKPSLSQEEIIRRLMAGKNRSRTKILEDVLKLSPTQYALLKFATTKEDFNDNIVLANKIKKLPLKICGAGPIDEAISTVGGISLDELNEIFELKKLPNTFCIGEMLDWDAPTGGYLLQACFSMGRYTGNILNAK